MVAGGHVSFVPLESAPSRRYQAGDRAINKAEAAVIRRTFTDYLAGKPSRTIALELNREGVPAPQAR
ncbi:recombinase family protein [Bradyrhizobium sp. CCGE-LA001]|uniref:recombinase family protein n=1 Tax=Bradyrhizobium sp. CCGE-LA001 TaxID=1223566 RepID=UPI001F1B3F77|nr:recombinase family protein [Bradyrhizobium sp. CCGE-LA001]